MPHNQAHPFRIVVLGDFSGRAARGIREVGDALAMRPLIPLDVDTIDDVIEGFAVSLTLPLGKDGGTVEVPLRELDDLHPDEIFDNLNLFSELKGLRQQLGVGSMADGVRERLKAWSQTHGTPVDLPKSSAGNAVPAHLKMSDFQALIGDTSGALSAPGPADDLMARVVGPHVVAAPDADAAGMMAAVDKALSGAMRMILHHPEFQAIEAQWRTLDLLARRVETDETLQIALIDVSAEELAMDIAAHDDLAQSGLFRVLRRAQEAGGVSTIAGLYTFEETPPHAEILGRLSQIAAHLDAPFLSAMSAHAMDVAEEDRHALTAQAWDALRDLPEAAHLGLCAPRFLLRQPYGATSDPISPFKFEEFTQEVGLSGLLWANPVALAVILLGATHQTGAMDLGRVMSLDDLPLVVVKDRHGDQVALPCTERNYSEARAQLVKQRGVMSVLWVKGSTEIRLGGFQSVAGGALAGPWDTQRRAPAPPTSSGAGLQLSMPIATDGPSDGLDDLLAGFDDADTTTPPQSDVQIDPELAALLESL